MKPGKKWRRYAVIGIVATLVVYALIQTQWVSKRGQGKAPADQQAFAALSSGRVTMIDLGASECIPCKMMAPIIKELKKEYAGKADIIFIDVWKNPDQAKKYGIRTIPTQIFFDQNGKEVHRNTGFLDKKRIIRILNKLGVS
jgi:thioredoxin 1